MKVDTVILVLLEILIVIGLSRLVGLGFRRIKQPLVIGEIVAGIMLGPSLFGIVAPDLVTTVASFSKLPYIGGFFEAGSVLVSALSFPAETIPYLGVLSQIGLIFFMFLIGLELDPKYLKGQIDIAFITSHASILVPFSLGTLLSLHLYPILSSSDVSFTAFALFLGAAMSITAFPVLARILTEQNLQGTRLGSLALTCAAVDDVTAWCLLAVAIAVAHSNTVVGAIPTIINSILYIGLMLTVGRSFLQKFATYYDRTGRLTQFALAWIYMGVVISAIITELIGIHLIFGAFLLGAAMPKHEGLTRELAQKTEDFVLTFLLPIFFAYSGLRTQIGLLNTPEAWVLCGFVLAVAIVGKFFGSYFAARFCGISNRESIALGWLMNTRGLTELIVLNIGLSLNVISPMLFTMLVIMALVTTFMTSPLVEWTYPKHLMRQDRHNPDEPLAAPDYRVLVPIVNPATQQGLIDLSLAIAVGYPPKGHAVVNPLSLIPMAEDYAYEGTPAEAERLLTERQMEVLALVGRIEPPEWQDHIQPIVRIAGDVAIEVAKVAQIDQADLILLGWHRPTFSSNRLGGRVGQILSTARTDVAVFVERQPTRFQKLLVPYVPNLHNDLGLEIALRLLINSPTATLTILRVTDDLEPEPISHDLRSLMEQLPVSVSDRIDLPQVTSDNPIAAVVQASAGVDLTIAGASREWGLERQTLGSYADALAVQCCSSLLITRRYSRVSSHLSSVLPQEDVPAVVVSEAL